MRSINEHNRILVLSVFVVGLGLAFVMGVQYGKLNVPETENVATNNSVRSRSLTGGSNVNRASRLRLRLPVALTAEGGSPEWVSLGLLSSNQIEPVVQDIVTCPDPLRRDFLFSHLLTKITEENVEDYWQAFKESSRDSQDDVRRLSLLSYRWGVLHGESAVRSALSGVDPEHRLLAKHAIEGWAAEQPGMALAFMQSEEGFKAQACRLGLLRGLGRSDPKAAADYLVELDGFTDARAYLKPVLDTQLLMDSDGAKNWVLNLPSERLKSQGLEMMAKKMFLKNPDEAVEWVNSFSDDPSALGAVTVVVTELMRSSDNEGRGVERTLNWIQGFTDGDVKNAAYESSWRSWSRKDLSSAAEYLNTLEYSPQRDFAVRGLSLEIVKKHPEAAVQWAETINDSELRHRTLILAAKAWIRRDPEAAGSWLQYSDVEEKTLLAIQGKD